MIMKNWTWGQDEPEQPKPLPYAGPIADVRVAGPPAVPEEPAADEPPGEPPTWVALEDSTPAIAPGVPAEQPEAAPVWEPAERLLESGAARDFQDRMRAVLLGFIDDPQEATRRADDLANEAMASLSDALATYKRTLDDRWGTEHDDTETHRQAVRAYRTFINRILNT